MAAIPQIPKIVTFTLTEPIEDGDDIDFSLDCTGAKVVPAPGQIVSETTLDGVTHSDSQPESWALELECLQDWDDERPGLASFLFSYKSLKTTFALQVTATDQLAAGTVTLVPIPYGGIGNQFAKVTVTLPLEGDPTFTPPA